MEWVVALWNVEVWDGVGRGLVSLLYYSGIESLGEKCVYNSLNEWIMFVKSRCSVPNSCYLSGRNSQPKPIGLTLARNNCHVPFFKPTVSTLARAIV